VSSKNPDSTEGIFLMIMISFSLIFLILIFTFGQIFYERGLPTKEKTDDNNQRLQIESDNIPGQDFSSMENS